MINVRDNWLEPGDDAAHHGSQMSGTGAQGWAANINRSHADNGSGY